MRGNLSGYWSRRIDQKRRLVYTVRDGQLIIVQAREHYCPAKSVSLPTFGAPGERLLVDIDDRGAVAEALGDNSASRIVGDDVADR